MIEKEAGFFTHPTLAIPLFFLLNVYILYIFHWKTLPFFLVKLVQLPAPPPQTQEKSHVRSTRHFHAKNYRSKANRSVVLEAVRGDGCALQFASDELRADPEERVFFCGGWSKGGAVVVLFCLGKTMGGDGEVYMFFCGWVGGFMQPRCWFISVYWLALVLYCFSVGKTVVLILSVSRQFRFFIWLGEHVCFAMHAFQCFHLVI